MSGGSKDCGKLLRCEELRKELVYLVKWGNRNGDTHENTCV